MRLSNQYATRPRHALVPATVLLVLLLYPFVAIAEDWDFTGADLDGLTASGGDLDYADDSDWFPDGLKDNLKKTIKKVLKPDPGDSAAPKSDGVNVRDFYHGHIGCPKPCTAEYRRKVAEFDQRRRALMAGALGGNWFDRVTEQNLEAFSAAMDQVELDAAALLEDCWKDGCVVIYHTYELNTPAGMGVSDPRRNVRTPKGGDPEPYRPPDQTSASSWMQTYCNCLQFAFLISEDGKIHVTVGTINNLSTVTGSPM
jgi:hypothetical protein